MKHNSIKKLNESAIVNEDESLNIDWDAIEKEGSKHTDGFNEKTLKLIKNIGRALKKPLKNFAAVKCGDLIDELLLGLFKDSIVQIYKEERLNNLSDEDALNELKEMKKDIRFKNGEEKSKLDSRKDDNDNAEIDPMSEKFQALWYSKQKDLNIGKILNQLVVEILKSAKKIEEDKSTLAAELKKLKIDNLSDEDIDNYGPVLKKMLDDKLNSKLIASKLKKLKDSVKESCRKQVEDYRELSLLKESAFVLTEILRNDIMLKALCESKELQEAVVLQILNEGVFSSISKLIPDKVKQSIKDFGAKTMKSLSNKTFQGILSLGGFAASAFTGGWAAALILRGIYVVELHGKQLKTAFERQYTRFANSGGIITLMDFNIKGDEEKKYSLRFYAKDMVWRLINVKDQLKHPSKDFVKKIVDSDEGKRYRDLLKSIWGPLFDNSKGGQIDFTALFERANHLGIPEKQLKTFKDFSEQYEKIESACIDSPKIDTRDQSIKKSKIL